MKNQSKLIYSIPMGGELPNGYLRRELPSVYVLKAICAFFVVLIHIPFLWSQYLQPLIVTAVPCFYLISGFFLYNGDAGIEISRAWSWIKKIFLINLVVNAIYIAYYYCVFGYTYSFGDIAHAIVTGSGVVAHTWYLAAMWEALVVFLLIRRKFPFLIQVAPFFLLLNLMLGRYNFLICSEAHHWPIYIRLNFLSVALPYLSLGYLLSRSRSVFENSKCVLLFLFAAIALLYGEDLLLQVLSVRSGGSYYCATVVLAVSLLVVALRYTDSRWSWLIYIGKYHSANIYYFHVLVGSVCMCLCKNWFDYSTWGALVVVFLCIPLSMAVNWGLAVLKHRVLGGHRR